jgi:hypothetical protein
VAYDDPPDPPAALGDRQLRRDPGSGHVPGDLFQKVEAVLLVERLEMRSVGFAALRGAFKVGNKPEDPNTEFLGCAPMRA